PDLFLLRHAKRRPPLVHHLAHAGWWLPPLFAAGREPLPVQRHVPAAFALREEPTRVAVKRVRAVVAPGQELSLVRPRAPDRERALHFVDLELDPVSLPVLTDHLADLGVLDELTAQGRDLDAPPPLAVGPQPVAAGVPLVEPQLVEHGVRLLRV